MSVNITPVIAWEGLNSLRFAAFVGDAQNTGEQINVFLSNLPDGDLFIQRMFLRVSGTPATPHTVIRGEMALVALFPPSNKTAANIGMLIHPQYQDGDAEGAPSVWLCESIDPFRMAIRNDWTMTILVPPADANATPVASYHFGIEFENIRGT